ncbi:hypothetical protein G6F65_020017 [Rhizopus arrhizus]|nr:hypothetical protein G6F65_020017 [Rhizopus arrhizus]
MIQRDEYFVGVHVPLAPRRAGIERPGEIRAGAVAVKQRRLPEIGAVDGGLLMFIPEAQRRVWRKVGFKDPVKNIVGPLLVVDEGVARRAGSHYSAAQRTSAIQWAAQVHFGVVAVPPANAAGDVSGEFRGGSLAHQVYRSAWFADAVEQPRSAADHFHPVVERGVDHADR